MKASHICLALALSIGIAKADFTIFAGYQSGSDVDAHSLIDLDVLDADNAVSDDPKNFDGAYDAYSVGGNSVKGSGAIRTIQGFSTAAESKMVGEQMYEEYAAYYGAGDYGDMTVSAALQGTDIFEGMAEVVREEIGMKVMVYTVTAQYVMHEFEDAIGDCNIGTPEANADGVHAWDEGVAFFVGSLPGPTAADSSGKLFYALGDKRCQNYGTCATEDANGMLTVGTSSVNTRLIEAFNAGLVKLSGDAPDCDAAAEYIPVITSLMNIPLMQGMLRYAYKADPEGGAGGAKEQAEGYAFWYAIAPRLDTCDSAAAERIADAMSITAVPAVPGGYLAVLADAQSMYECLGITQADMGGLIDSEGTGYYPGFGPTETVVSDGEGGLTVVEGEVVEEKSSAARVTGAAVALAALVAALL